ncbi:transcription factor bHLH68-like [Prosopis cineraria]|uniref:transcription factor bHLH68-like n=1 Tax=Prosopis cineraria TaxID=364024 RepID=UPI00240FF9BE|nr:transcription factor bHLH68-like [Prosopis cineraria]
MGGNPNLWSNMHDANYVLGSSIPFNSLPQNPEPPSSWSQLLFSGAPGEEKRLGFDHFQAKKLGTWEEQVLDPCLSSTVHLAEGIKQETGFHSRNLYGHAGEEFQGTSSSSGGGSAAIWSHMVVPVSSSPGSCVTSLTSSSNYNNNSNNTVLDSFSYKKADTNKKNHLLADHSSECSTAAGRVFKKARVQASSSLQPPLKVRKEKLGDRISALHQLVSPFGKTDTASVLLEAIGYIRFLHGQIEALCFPYFGNSSKNLRNHHFVNHGDRNSVFPEDPGQLLNNESSLKRNGAPNQESEEEKAKDLRSRGLCLVPVSLSHHFGSDHNIIGADFWSSAYGSGF